ncbi:MAG TPA: MerR family transcriptional regulator [Bacteroidia bacterium]|nr:MerR family transcriptional regulator [Bacteroidia bacterium]
MNRYSISDLETISGIKAHTIRIWEQRYDALKPMRSPGNTRYYDDQQLRKLLNIVSLSDTGKKISELFSLSDEQIKILLEEQIENLKAANIQYEYFISQMLISGLSYNEAEFEKQFSACILRYGLKNTYLKIIHPMLVRIGLVWGKDDLCPSQEHFLSNLIRQKIISSIDGLPYPTNDKKNWLLFLPNEEYHEIGLIYSNYLIRAAGQKTVYLGSNVPFDSVLSTIHDITPTDIFLFFIRNRSVAEAQEYLTEVRKRSKNATIHISGNKKLIEQLRLEKNMYWHQSVEDLEKKLT